MPNYIDHLKNADQSRKVLACASGRHICEGHLVSSYYDGANVFFLMALAQTAHRWEGIEGVWYEGVNIPAANYHFLDGSQVAPSSWFADFPAHTGTVMLAVKLPTGTGSTDTAANPPVQQGRDDLGVMAKCDRHPDFDANGNQINPATGAIVATASAPLDKSFFTYSVNPGRVAAGYYLAYGLDALRSDINWTIWTQFRDYHDSGELIDYASIPGFKGYGLTGSFYNGTNFETLVAQRVDPVVEFAESEGAPAVGMNVSEFSVRWRGSVKATAAGEYTFRLDHDNGARLFVTDMTVAKIDQWASVGVHDSAAITLAANSFNQITVEWTDAAGAEPNPAKISLKWKKPGDADFSVVPSANLYPFAKNAVRYESHPAFSTPTTMDDALDFILFVSNSIRQDVGGKMEFRCVEQVEPTFNLSTGTVPEQILSDRVAISRLNDLRNAELRNIWEAEFRDLDSQYLEAAIEPPVIKIDALIAASGREIFGSPIFLGSMSKWQARKVLLHIANRSSVYDLVATFDGSALTYPITAQDIGYFNVPEYGITTRLFMALEVTSRSPVKTADTKIFRLQEWQPREQFVSELNLAG